MFTMSPFSRIKYNTGFVRIPDVKLFVNIFDVSKQTNQQYKKMINSKRPLQTRKLKMNMKKLHQIDPCEYCNGTGWGNCYECPILDILYCGCFPGFGCETCNGSGEVICTICGGNGKSHRIF